MAQEEMLIIPTCEIGAVIKKDNKLNFPNGLDVEIMMGAFDALEDFVRTCTEEQFAKFAICFMIRHQGFMDTLKRRCEKQE